MTSDEQAATDDALYFWVITDHPKDYPDSFVLRRWKVVDGVGVPEKDYQLFKTIEQAREAIPGDVVPMPLSEADDPVIVEWWM
jgi:hypothetical protein